MNLWACVWLNCGFWSLQHPETCQKCGNLIFHYYFLNFISFGNYIKLWYLSMNGILGCDFLSTWAAVYVVFLCFGRFQIPQFIRSGKQTIIIDNYFHRKILIRIPVHEWLDRSLSMRNHYVTTISFSLCDCSLYSSILS